MNQKANIAVDIGNTKIKAAVFEGDTIVSRFSATILEEIYHRYEKNHHSWIFSSVSKPYEEISELFEGEDVLFFSKDTPLPIAIRYDTPETLGLDRIAAAAGANYFYPGNDVLVIDLGTCITYDIIDRSNCFQGGVIAPGFKMRMRAMHHFTHRLPDLSSEWETIPDSKIGKSTRECMVNGSYTALIHEINGFIEFFKKEYEQLTVVMTGGDAAYFEYRLNSAVFVNFDLVHVGLNRILGHNQ